MCLKRQTSESYQRLVEAETSKGIFIHGRVKGHAKTFDLCLANTQLSYYVLLLSTIIGHGEVSFPRLDFLVFKYRIYPKSNTTDVCSSLET